MVGTPVGDRYLQQGPSPAFFSTRIWEFRASLMPEFLDPDRIALLTEMYGYIDSLVRSRINDGSYPTGGWISSRVADVANRMKEAATSLENAIAVEERLSWWSKVRKALRVLVQ
jgi:hypothetical protein